MKNSNRGLVVIIYLLMINFHQMINHYIIQKTILTRLRILFGGEHRLQNNNV